MRKSTILLVISCLVYICFFASCRSQPTVEPPVPVEKKIYPGAVGPIR